MAFFQYTDYPLTEYVRKDDYSSPLSLLVSDSAGNLSLVTLDVDHPFMALYGGEPIAVTPEEMQELLGIDLGQSWTAAENLDVDPGAPRLIDSFTIDSADLTSGNCFWTFVAWRDAGGFSAGTIDVAWVSTTYYVSTFFNDDEWTEPTFTIAQVDNGATCTVSLYATVTTSNWKIKVQRAPYSWGVIAPI